MASNTIRVDRGELHEVLLAALAFLEGRGETYIATTPPARIAATREAAESLHDQLLA